VAAIRRSYRSSSSGRQVSGAADAEHVPADVDCDLDVAPNGNYRDRWFKYQGSFSNGGSFPSGHVASAFAVATAISARYREHRWVPGVAYGTATFIALTRLPDQAHFSSDIFFGAAKGYSISRFVVLRR
jgi:membrane-associated phospholipid phosphatase